VSEANITATNKALVLKAITGCFFDRDTSIPGKHFAPDYKQHNPSIPNGNAATLALITALSPRHAQESADAPARGPKKTGPLRVRFTVRRPGGRQSPSRGEQLATLRLQSGRMGNRLPPVGAVCRRDFLTQHKGLHASHAAIV
jgi:hypothetical protein